MNKLLLSCDWGTTFLRLRLVECDEFRLLAESRSKRGVFSISEQGASPSRRAEAFESALNSAVDELDLDDPSIVDGVPVVISGMASSSIGWRELPYAVTPFSLNGTDLSWAELPTIRTDRGQGNKVFLLSGVRTATDVMRGEEVELIGLMSLPEYAELADTCLILLPGTHSKHVDVRNSVLEDFRTYMTGELYEVLGTASVLQHSVVLAEHSESASRVDGTEAFIDGLMRAQKGSVLQLLFQVRTNQVLGGIDHGENAYFLSGLLIGTELRDCRDRYGLDHPILLHGPTKLRELYRKAFDELGFQQVRITTEEQGEMVAACGQNYFLTSVVEK